MSPEFPYQLVAFLDKVPEIGEGVYQGKNGWYPQLTLKRRFAYGDTTDDIVTAKIQDFFAGVEPITISIGELTQPERMPVRVLSILNETNLKELHLKFIEFMGDKMRSRYPERDGENYLPHITAEYGGLFVINVDAFKNRDVVISSVCLIKDGDDGDSHVVSYIPIGTNESSKFVN